MKKHSILFLLLVSLLLISCKKNSCPGYRHAYIGSIDGDSKGNINKEIELKVWITVLKGEGEFGFYTETKTGNTRIIKAYATNECCCTDIAPSVAGTYSFRASKPGIYYLKFLQPNDTYFSDTLTIQ